jgi:hypothetical protein
MLLWILRLELVDGMRKRRRRVSVYVEIGLLAFGEAEELGSEGGWGGWTF